MTVLQEINIVSVCLRIVLALVIGGLLGLERGRKNRPAGFRTYMLVCLGSTLIMMTNQYVYQCFQTTDPVRLGAQVVSGIGFLGAGTIIVTGRNQIKGITTAAGMWTAAACGLAIGIGFYLGAILGGITIFFVMSSMRNLDTWIRRHASIVELYLEFDAKRPMSEFLNYIRQQEMDVVDLQINKSKIAKNITQCALLSVESQKKRSHVEILELIRGAPGVQFMEEL